METLEEIKEKIGLADSIERLKIGLIYSYLYKTISTKALAKKMEVPVPIATAFKKELVKVGWMKRESFYYLTPLAKSYVMNELGYKGVEIDLYKLLLEDESSKQVFLEKVKTSLLPVFEKRPVAKRELDQAHATLDTVVKRVALLLADPLIFSKKIAFVGDDDLVSIFLSKALVKLGYEGNSTLYVYDIDTDLLMYIKENESLKVMINVVKQDFRVPFQIIENQMDVIFTDPPYTPEGIITFIHSGEKLLKNKGKMYVSFNHKTPEVQGFIQNEINRRGFNFIEVVPDFNQYLGGSIIGNVSNLYVIQKIDSVHLIHSSESLYTRSLKKNEASKRLGFHTLYDLRGCRKELLTDVEIVGNKMRHMSQQFKLNVVEEEFHQFKPYGVSGVMVLQESHFTIHTWPEHGYIAIDLFVCEEMIDEQEFLRELQKMFEPTSCEMKKVYRES